MTEVGMTRMYVFAFAKHKRYVLVVLINLVHFQVSIRVNLADLRWDLIFPPHKKNIFSFVTGTNSSINLA
jgi:hypothetical protein